MSLEDSVMQQKKRATKRYLSFEALAQVEKGNKFIVIQDDFDPSNVPEGYTLIEMKHKGSSFKMLVPQALLFYMANPGEGDANDALEEIADFYHEAEDFEDGLIEEGKTNVQEANWATLARGSYETYLVNKLVKHRKEERDKMGEPIPEFDAEVLHGLNLDDSYVKQRAIAIAALALGKSADQINAHEVKDVLKHVTIREHKTEQLSKEEFDRVTCWAGSHYEIKPECRNMDGVSYGIEHRHDKRHKSGTKRTEYEGYTVLDAKIADLENDITNYRKSQHGDAERHDKALIRQYINLAYIAPENPKAQLAIKPPEKIQIPGDSMKQDSGNDDGILMGSR